MKRLNRLSTFFSTLTPRVFMASEGGEGSPSSSRAYSPTLEEEEEEGEESTDSVSCIHSVKGGPTCSCPLSPPPLSSLLLG